jgi:transcriptional regulator
MAKGNPQWREIEPDAAALAIVAGPEAYISPSWYATKAEHGKVVPTWNYSAVHLTGTVRVHEDAEWLRTAITELTDLHEHDREHPWQPTDAPAHYVEGQLRGIVGLELTITRVDAKAKLSQNRSDADQQGVIDALLNEPFPGAVEVAAAMSRTRED